jgi:hypothetical protein
MSPVRWRAQESGAPAKTPLRFMAPNAIWPLISPSNSWELQITSFCASQRMGGEIADAGRIPGRRGYPINHHVAGAAPSPADLGKAGCPCPAPDRHGCSPRTGRPPARTAEPYPPPGAPRPVTWHDPRPGGRAPVTRPPARRTRQLPGDREQTQPPPRTRAITTISPTWNRLRSPTDAGKAGRRGYQEFFASLAAGHTPITVPPVGPQGRIPIHRRLIADVLICREARRQASQKWMFCALSTMYLREPLAETESAIWR